MDMFDLSGRVALVTGGSRGLGLAMARALGRAGAIPVLLARKPDELEAALASLDADGIAAQARPFDLQRLDDIPALVADLVAAHGRLDILVNNAGTSWGAPAADYPPQAWRKVMGLNLDAAFELSRHVARAAMLPAGRGSIVMVSSIAGLGAGRGDHLPAVAYHASKAGVINLARALAAEWGGRGIRVNALCPGWFPTDMSEVVIARHREAFLERIPLGRFGEAESADIMGPLLFLASDASRYVTGAVLAADGGISALVG
jgi:gluconate 5-dehydrogenase